MKEVPSSSQYMLIKEGTYEIWEIRQIIIWHHQYNFIISSWTDKNNIELHLYLRLDRRQKSKRDARVNTSQREQYGGTVHLFIGKEHNLCKITFTPFMFTIDVRTIYRGLNSLFLFKSVPFSASELIRPLSRSCFPYCGQLRSKSEGSCTYISLGKHC
jgi:hypothetical protein